MTEPMPRPGHANIFDLAREVLEQRAKQGMETYGRPLESFNGRNPARDALEEAADQFVYLIQLCEEREKMLLWMSDAYGILAATGHGISLRQRADDLLGTDGRPWR